MLTVSSIAKLWNNREFIMTLSRREIVSRYKQSLFGKLWIILQPLGLMIVLTVVFSLFVKLPSEGVPYAPFLFVALLPYMYMNNTVNTSTKLINTYSGLIKQRNFFRPSLVFTKFLSETVKFGFALIGLAIVLLFYNIIPGFYALYAIPILAIQMMLILGIMFFLSATNVYVRDIGMVVPLGIRMLRYLSPIMYSYHSLPIEYQPYLALNPLTGIFDGYRQTILHNQAPDMTLLLYSFIFSLFVFLVGWFTFMKLEKNFADVV
jgi:ABC-type polysaccharide/polyol phosphate export permease